MNLWSLLESAIQPSADVMAGYERGQELGRERKRAEDMQDAALQRQGVLDKLRASVMQSQIGRNNAYSDFENRRASGPTKTSPYLGFTAADGTLWLRNRDDPNDIIQAKDATGQTIPMPKRAGSTTAPPRIQTDKGWMERDADGTWHYIKTPTGDIAKTIPRVGGAGNVSPSQELARTRAALDEAMKAQPRPSKAKPTPAIDPVTGHMKIVQPDLAKVAADSAAYEQQYIAPLRAKILEMGGAEPGGGDPGPVGAAARAASGAVNRSSISGTPTSMTADQMTAYKAELDRANAAYQRVLGNPRLTDEQKSHARDLYDQSLTAIAKKYTPQRAAPAKTMEAPKAATPPKQNEEPEAPDSTDDGIEQPGPDENASSTDTSPFQTMLDNLPPSMTMDDSDPGDEGGDTALPTMMPPTGGEDAMSPLLALRRAMPGQQGTPGVGGY
ncbi:MAG TPA: hypothetical protein VNN79_12140 [Actinomycetota bacterium]|nr:hypothetical protein [Actinomycetota bacterium]